MDVPRQTLRAVYEYFWLIAGHAYFALGCAVLGTLAFLLSWVLPSSAGERIGVLLTGALFRSFLSLLRASGLVKLDLAALDRLRGAGGIIIAPNHPCLMDAVFVLSRVPEGACIMKAELWNSPVLAGGARLARHIRNDSPTRMVREAARKLDAGRPVLIFPEGTRTRGQPVNRFKAGIALIAKQAGAPVQTVFIEANSAFLGKGWPLLKRPMFPVVYRVRLGRRFAPSHDARAFLTELEGYYRDELTGRAEAPVASLATASAPPSHRAAA
jgi:1-acyl-sn-glycerol-3-phosphate acyltransferase